jgi:hypothetical protein
MPRAGSVQLCSAAVAVSVALVLGQRRRSSRLTGSSFRGRTAESGYGGPVVGGIAVGCVFWTVEQCSDQVSRIRNGSGMVHKGRGSGSGLGDGYRASQWTGAIAA